MRILAIPSALAVLLAFCLPAQAQPAPAGPNDPLVLLVKRRLDASPVPACAAVALVGATQKTAFVCGKGAGPRVPDRHSIFEIGSLSKVFTGLLLADMAKRGDLRIEEPASKYALPGAKLPTRDGREITLVDLVTHRAALPRLPPGFRPLDVTNPYAKLDTKALYESLARTELSEGLGERQSYSSFGYLWLSDLLGRRYGKPYDVMLRERILAPLGMDDTAVRLDERRLARLIDGHAGAYKVVRHWDYDPALAGAGGIRTSLHDMIRFAEAAVGQRESPLKETFALSYTPLRQVSEGTSTLFAWGMRKRTGGRLMFHNGRTAGFHATMVLNPDAQTAVIVLADADLEIDDLAFHLMDSTLPLKFDR